MLAPTIAELLNDAVVRQALEEAWVDSEVNDPARRHEEGGWIYRDTNTGATIVQRAPAGGQADLDLNNPPIIVGSVVVGTFHTHPNPSADGWDPGPSPAGYSVRAASRGAVSDPGGRRRVFDGPGFTPRRVDR